MVQIGMRASTTQSEQAVVSNSHVELQDNVPEAQPRLVQLAPPRSVPSQGSVIGFSLGVQPPHEFGDGGEVGERGQVSRTPFPQRGESHTSAAVQK